MTCPYLLILALATTCHPSLNDALQHGMAAYLDGAESVVVEDVRRGRRWEIREVTDGSVYDWLSWQDCAIPWPGEERSAVETYLGGDPCQPPDCGHY